MSLTREEVEVVNPGFEQTCVGGQMAAGPPTSRKDTKIVSMRDEASLTENQYERLRTWGGFGV